jgi:hypothetical protein
MKFPITKEELQAYDEERDKAEEEKEKFEKGISILVTNFCRDLKRVMPRCIETKQYGQYISPYYLRTNSMRDYFTGKNEVEIIPRMIERLKEMFIGCQVGLRTDISSGPYVAVNWS